MLTAVASAAGCATQVIAKDRMTLAEADIGGMECRKETPIGTNKARTICASPEAWAKFDAKQKQEAEYDMESVRSGHYVNAFRRP